MGAKRRRHRDSCGCQRNVVPGGVALVLDDALDELDQEMRNLRELDAAAFYDPVEVTEQCR
jgi:hypothetical protein